jgi:hypothetical protein
MYLNNMIVQITIARNELHSIKELLPIWKNYSDAFVFLLHNNTDETKHYLNSVKSEYNILNILEVNDNGECPMETDTRQLLFDEALKHTDKIICLDADEYLDGTFTKSDLYNLLESNKDTVFYMNWIQYTSSNTIRVDGPWRHNLKDRVGCYTQPIKFESRQMHSTHLPIPVNSKVINRDSLFIAHLHWLDKNYAAVKQYYWKVEDYYNNKKFKVDVTDSVAYDASVNSFNWEEEYIDVSLKVKDDLYEDVGNYENHKVDIIKERTKLYNIQNLGDWGFGVVNSVPMYFCTAADSKHFPLLINLIGSIHQHNFYDTVQIRVYDLGLTEVQRYELSCMKKVLLCDVPKLNPDILTPIQTAPNRHVTGLFSWKPAIIKDSLEQCEYVLYLDAGTTLLKPANDMFHHIIENGSLLFDCGHSIKWMTTSHVIDTLQLNSGNNAWLLSDDIIGIDAGFMGISQKLIKDFVNPMYELAKDIKNFYDDGSCPDGWGTGRHDQTLFSILARQLGLDIKTHDNPNVDCFLNVRNNKIKFHITHNKSNVKPDTNIFRSRWNFNYESFKVNSANIRRKYLVSVITAVGPSDRYSRFLENYFNVISQQYMFNRIEFILVYSDWSPIFDRYTTYDNIRFIKEDISNGVYNAWNIGIHHSTCEFVTNWNVDDIRMPVNNLVKYKLINSDSDIDMVYNYYIGVEDSELGELDLSSNEYIPYPDEFHKYVTTMCMAGPDPMWRKTANIFFGGFDYQNFSIIGDWEMWIRMAKNGLKFKLIPYPLAVYVNHSDTVSNSDSFELDKQKELLKFKYKF